MATSQPEETELPQIVNLSQARVETIQAGLVRTSQTAIQNINAEEVDLQTSLAASIKTGEFHAHDSVLGAVISQNASLQDSIAGGVRAETLSFNGSAFLNIANTMTSKDVNAVAVVTTDLQADNIRTGILISREVHGNVTTTVDGRTALLGGLVGGAVTGLILLAGKLLFRPKN
jgi:hypothetical protein